MITEQTEEWPKLKKVLTREAGEPRVHGLNPGCIHFVHWSCVRIIGVCVDPLQLYVWTWNPDQVIPACITVLLFGESYRKFFGNFFKLLAAGIETGSKLVLLLVTHYILMP